MESIAFEAITLVAASCRIFMARSGPSWMNNKTPDSELFRGMQQVTKRTLSIQLEFSMYE